MTINTLKAGTRILFTDGDVYTVVGRPERMFDIFGNKVPANAPTVTFIGSGEIVRDNGPRMMQTVRRVHLRVRMVNGEIVAADRDRIGRGLERATLADS